MSIGFKPQSAPWNLKGELSLQELTTHLTKVITQNYSGKVRKLLVELIAMSTTTNASMQVDVKDIPQNDMNSIITDFGESIGPLFVKTHNLMPVRLSANVKALFPSSGSEAAYDFKIIDGKEVYTMSSKKMRGGTNTLKPGDVVKTVEADPVLLNKWKNSPAYNTMKILNDCNVITGPMTAVQTLYSKHLNLPHKDFSYLTGIMSRANDCVIPQVPKSVFTLIESNTSLKSTFAAPNAKKAANVVTGSIVNTIFESALVQISKSRSYADEYNELFLDVTNGKIYYVKFDISSQGKVEWKVEVPSINSKKAALRSKNYAERRSSSSGSLKLDKLGFQP